LFVADRRVVWRDGRVADGCNRLVMYAGALPASARWTTTDETQLVLDPGFNR